MRLPTLPGPDSLVGPRPSARSTQPESAKRAEAWAGSQEPQPLAEHLWPVGHTIGPQQRHLQPWSRLRRGEGGAAWEDREAGAPWPAVGKAWDLDGPSRSISGACRHQGEGGGVGWTCAPGRHVAGEGGEGEK